MYLHRDDLKKINDIVAEFPDVETFKVESDTSSGIGAVVTLTVTTTINGRSADVTYEISGVENW